VTFSTDLNADTFTLTVVDAVGVHVDNADARIFARDPRTIVVSLPPLEEGLYTVTYTVTDIATQTTTTDSYQFALDFASPQIRLASPPNGAGFETNVVKVEVDTGEFDLAYWEHSWRLYLDDRPVITTRRPEITLRDLDNGVHELRVILINPDGEELRNTQSAIHIAIGEPDPQAEQIARAASGPGDPGLRLSRSEVITLSVVAVVCLGLGVLLGLRSEPDAA
jgi:hypothetical protein